MQRPSNRGGLVARAALVVVALGLGAAGASSLHGCEPTRFPVCHKNEDCLTRDADVFGPVCFDLRCVECAYDSDCKGGHVCSRNQTCEGLVAAPPPRPRQGAAPDSTWSGSFEQCAAQCKDEACLKKCDGQQPQ